MRITPPSGLIKLVTRRLEAKQAKLHADAERAQAKLLARIVELYRGTIVGRELGLTDVRSVSSFRALVPLRTGGEYAPLWSRVLEANTPGLLHPKPLKYVAVSSGSSGASKPVPVPTEALDNYRRFTNHCFFHAFHELGVYDLFDGHVLVAAGPPMKEIAKSGVIVGFGSGIAALEAPRFARALVRPTPEIQGIADRDEKLARLTDEALPLDVRAITGMPNAATPMLEALLAAARVRGRDARTVRELFPRLSLYGYSGMPLGPWAEHLRALLGEGVTPFEIYSSTECPVGFQHRVGEPGLLVDLTAGVFELVPSDAPLAARIGIADAELGRVYDLVVTSWGGAFAYGLGDRVRFTSKNPYVLEFAGRVTEEISVAGEKLGLHVLESALSGALAETGRALGPFVVTQTARVPGESPAYDFFVEAELEHDDADALGARVDARLRAVHSVYATFRAGDASLGAPRVRALPRGTLERVLHAEKTFGHAKLPPIQRDRAFVPSVLAAAAAIRNGDRA